MRHRPKLEAMLFLRTQRLNVAELVEFTGWPASKVRYLLRHRCWPWTLTPPVAL